MLLFAIFLFFLECNLQMKLFGRLIDLVEIRGF